MKNVRCNVEGCISEESFSPTALKSHIRAVHQSQVLVTYRNVVEKVTLTRCENSGVFSCGCGYSNKMPYAMQRHASRCQFIVDVPPVNSQLSHEDQASSSSSRNVTGSDLSENLSGPLNNSADAHRNQNFMNNSCAFTDRDGYNSDDTSNTSQVQSEPMRSVEIEDSRMPFLSDSEDYDHTFDALGITIHRSSGATFCLNSGCRKAVHFEKMFHHLSSKHNLKEVLIAKSIQITEKAFTDNLSEKGANSICDMGMYMHPSRTLLPVVSALESYKGYMCNLCPSENVTTCAYYSQSVATMIKHIGRVHPGVPSRSYSSCMVQCLFKHQQDKVYFGVVPPESEVETTSSVISDEVKARLSSLLERSKTGIAFTHPLKCVQFMEQTDDPRLFSRFYKETNWYSFVPEFVEEDSIQNRIRLYQWVNLPTLHSSLKYLVEPVDMYFKNIQDLLNTKNYFYFWRRKVMAMNRDTLPTTGLSPLSANSVKAYSNVWKKFIMMILIQFMDADAAQEAQFSITDAVNFSKIVLTSEEIVYLKEFTLYIQQQRDTYEKDDFVKVVQPEYHELFLRLIQRESAPGNYPFKSPFSVFCAFSQIDYEGTWKPVQNASSIPAKLLYWFRAITLFDIVSKERTRHTDLGTDQYEVNLQSRLEEEGLHHLNEYDNEWDESAL